MGDYAMNGVSTSYEMKNEGRRRGRMKIVMVFGSLIIVLGGGAFIAGRLLGEELPVTHSDDIQYVESEGGSVAKSAVRLEPDEKLPDRMPTAVGQFHHRDDKRIFINQYPPPGQMVILDEIDEYPIMEIVVTRDTLLYKDVTDLSQAYESGVAQQVVAPGSVEDLDQGCSIVVWGEQQGDRIVAEVLQYTRN